MKSKKEPPVVLVKTWIGLMMSSEDKEVKDRASGMLMKAFEDMKAVAEYAEKHQIKLK